MLRNFHGVVLGRDGLTTGITQLNRLNLTAFEGRELARTDLPSRGAIIGRWSPEASDPFPELMIVRDEDYSDTLAWLASYFNNFAPITQWCRILTQPQALQMWKRTREVALGRYQTAWIGAILAECSAQSPSGVNLRELHGTAALSSATFAAARAVAVWGDEANLHELARRHDELAPRLREGTRPLTAASLLPVWEAISGNSASAGTSATHRRAIEPLVKLVRRAIDFSQLESGEIPVSVVESAGDTFDLPELINCAKGPQADRVRALDRLAERLVVGPRSPAIDGLLGFAASLVDPGAAVLPDLLRKYLARLPTASIWLGAFAGAWSPLRVLSEQQGLGRLISKVLLAETDFTSRPSCDAAYDEIDRWLGPAGTNQRVIIRGMSSRSLSIEIDLGVTCSFAFGRPESVQAREQTRSDAAEEFRNRSIPSSQRVLFDLRDAVRVLTRRVEQLEQTNSGLREPNQPGLGLPEPDDGAGKRGRRARR
jgi:hypothetical protein